MSAIERKPPYPSVTTTHNTTLSGRFALPNIGHPFMFARRLDLRWRKWREVGHSTRSHATCRTTAVVQIAAIQSTVSHS